MACKGRIAIVTGSGSPKGIGRAVALKLSEDGAIVVVADFKEDIVNDTVELIKSKGGEAFGVLVDVSKEESVKNMVKTVIEKYGRIDILINNAGISQSLQVCDITLDDWNRLVSVNLTGVFLCTREVLPYMKAQKYGRIVFTSSAAGKQGGGFFGGAHYSATKGGVLGFANTVARETALEGITSNCICPGLIQTEIWKTMPKEKSDAIIAGIPMKRTGDVKEVAAAFAFLASDEASYITGEALDVNGGIIMD